MGTKKLTKIILLSIVLMLCLGWYGKALAVDSTYPPYFPWWGNPKDLVYANMAAPGPVQDIAFWENRGGMCGAFIGIGPSSIGYIDHGMSDILTQKLENAVNMGYKAIALEIERDTDSEDAAALAAFKQAHPDIFVAAWLVGTEDEHPWAELDAGIDLFMYEVYISLGHSYKDFDYFIDIARRYNIIDKSIFAISTSHGPSILTIESIEDQFDYIRKKGPEMPGMAIFVYLPLEPLWNQAIDNLCGKYFVDSVLTIKAEDISFSDSQPDIGEDIVISAEVHNIGYSAAIDVPVEFFDGNPNEDGALIGSAVISEIAANGTAQVETSWESVRGMRDIYVKVTNPQGLALLPQAYKTMIVAPAWWDCAWDYRIPIIVPSTEYDRIDMPLELSVDFSGLLNGLGTMSDLDENSIRIIEYDKDGGVVAEAPSRFNPDGSSVSWLLDSLTLTGEVRYFYLYFDDVEDDSKDIPIYPSDVNQNGWVFTNSYYSLALGGDGYTIDSLLPVGGNDVLTRNWRFQWRIGSTWYYQDNISGSIASVNHGSVYTTVEVNGIKNGASLLTKYYLYSGSPVIRIDRTFGPALDVASININSAVEGSWGIAEHEGSYQLGHEKIEVYNQLQDGRTKESYFGGSLGPGNENKCGWIDWSWPVAFGGGVGVAVDARWSASASSIYDLTRHYDASDSIEIWELYGMPTVLDEDQTSRVYLIPHPYLNFSDTSIIAPAYKVWMQTHYPLTLDFPVEACPDNQAPLVTITSPTEYGVYTAGTIDFEISAQDTQSGTKLVGAVLSSESIAEPILMSSTSGFISDQEFLSAGVYSLTVTAEDNAGNIAIEDRMVVIYDPTAGFITGGGWIDSPLGAYAANPALIGKAEFGFVSKYKKGTSIPEGNTQFQFKAGDLNFHSTYYDWLVVAGTQAKFKGSGTINGLGDFAFMLTAIDGTSKGIADQFRIKIWNKLTQAVVYDNKMGASDSSYDATAIGGGSIVIHK